MKPPFACYVAGSSKDLGRARNAVAALRARGVAVIGDEWIDEVEAHGGNDAELPFHILEACAGDDVGSVRTAKMVLVLCGPHGASDGATFEAGVAEGAGVPFVTSGGPIHPLFRTRALAEFASDSAAADFVVAYAVGWSVAQDIAIDRYKCPTFGYAEDPPEVPLDAEELPPAPPTETAATVRRPQDFLASLGDSPDIRAARAAGRAAVRGGDDE